MKNNDPDVHRLEEQLCEQLQRSSDFVCKTIAIESESYRAYFLRSLVDLPMTLSVINRIGMIPDGMRDRESPRATERNALTRLYDSILLGKLVLFGQEGMVAVIEPKHPNISRQVSTPNSENPLQSAFDAFTEDIDINIGLLRKKMVSDRLVIETRVIGTRSVKKIAIVYIDGTARPEIIAFIRKKLEDNSGRELSTARDLSRILGHPELSLAPTYITSELPGETMQSMQNGKVVILMDQFSFAFALPAIVSDLWSTTLDVQYPLLFQMFLRTIRSMALLFSLTLPGMYVVLNSVNPELLRIQLALTVAESRQGVPYPSLIEVLLVLILLEMIIEATIRLPKNIGPTITMVGGILLGQAIVQAKLVSNLLIIILVASAIANFALSSYMNAIGVRLFKYVILIASSMYGIWGLEVAMIWLTLYFASLSTCTIPYLSFSLKRKASDG